MSRMIIDSEKCTLCGVCVDSCPFGAMEIVKERVVISDECRFCGACVEACPQGAIAMEQEEQAQEPDTAAPATGDYAGVLVYVELQAGRIHPVSLEMMGKGLELAKSLGQKLSCVVAGWQVQALAAELLWYGADLVIAYDQPELAYYRPEPYTHAVCAAVAELRPGILLFGATHLGRSLAPRVATRLRTGLTADCTSLDVRPNGDLVQTRPAFGGNVMARIITPRHRPQVATVRYKVMAPAARLAAPHGAVQVRRLAPAALVSGIAVLDVIEQAQTASITDAEIIVAAGRGAGNPRGLALVAALAQRIGGVVGSSRPLVEQGLFPHAQQVGLSGRTVRPKLYIACGISGAVQHLAGMRGADYIVAVNKDPHAPIFATAHVAIVGDLHEVLPRLIAQLERDQSDGANAAS